MLGFRDVRFEFQFLCESFMKTLKREEIYAKKYKHLEQLRANIEEFIEQYYNRQRLHSALGYRENRRTYSAGGSRSFTRTTSWDPLEKIVIYGVGG
jgi:transposase InsO family protein